MRPSPGTWAVNEPTLRNRLRQNNIDKGRRNNCFTTEEREELFNVRRRVEVLDEEKVILRAGTSFAEEANILCSLGFASTHVVMVYRQLDSGI